MSYDAAMIKTTATAAVVLALGCGSGGGSEERTSGPIADRITSSERGLRFHAVRHQVDLATLPVQPLLGLPASGTVEIDADLTVPADGRRRDWSAAKGSFAVRCVDGCRIGDDVTKLVPKARNTRSSAFVGDGLDFGHVDLDAFTVRMVVADGRLAITEWTVRSPDLVLDVSGDVRLSRDLEDSTIDVCIRFEPTEALRQRDPKTHAVFAFLGKALLGNGPSMIAVGGTIENARMVPRPCGAAAAP